MIDYKQQIKIPEIIKAKIVSDKIVTSGMVHYEIQTYNTFNDPELANGIEGIKAATACYPYIPKKDDHVLVFSPSIDESNREYYILGKVQDPLLADKPNEFTSAKDGSFHYKNKKGTLLHIHGINDYAFIGSPASSLEIDQKSLKLISNSNSIEINNNAINVNVTDPNGGDIVNRLNMDKNGFKAITDGNIIFKAGGTKDDIGNKTIKMFGGSSIIELSNVYKLEAGTIQEKASAMLGDYGYANIKLTSKKLSLDPSAITDPTYSVSVLEGDTEFTNSFGSIKLNALSPIGSNGPTKIELSTGLTPIDKSKISIGSALTGINLNVGPPVIGSDIKMLPGLIKTQAGPLPVEPAVLGLKLSAFLTQLLTYIISHNHVCAVGPTSPPIPPSLIGFTMQMAQIPTILSPTNLHN